MCLGWWQWHRVSVALLPCALLGSINTQFPSQSPARAPWQEQLLAQTLFSFLLHGISGCIKPKS